MNPGVLGLVGDLRCFLLPHNGESTKRPSPQLPPKCTAFTEYYIFFPRSEALICCVPRPHFHLSVVVTSPNLIELPETRSPYSDVSTSGEPWPAKAWVSSGLAAEGTHRNVALCCFPGASTGDEVES